MASASARCGPAPLPFADWTGSTYVSAASDAGAAPSAPASSVKPALLSMQQSSDRSRGMRTTAADRPAALAP
jgi:hypothetical protein